MKKVFALLCGILLLCAACTPVPPETPEQSADATTATTTTADTVTTTETTTASTTATATNATTATPSTTAKPTTTWKNEGYRPEVVIPFTVDGYRAFLNKIKKDPQIIKDTFERAAFYKPENFREWFVDKQAYVPCLSGDWYIREINLLEDHEMIINQYGTFKMQAVSSTYGEYNIVTLNHYMCDSERVSVDGWLSACFGDDDYEIVERRTLTTKDGREGVYLEARRPEKDSHIEEGVFIHIDGYDWQVTMSDWRSYVVEELVRNLSFEKIEL